MKKQGIQILTLLPFLLAGCTTVNQPVKEVVLAPKPIPVITPKQVKRQPGSLWSDDSRWNEMYSIPVSRLVGDVVNLKVDELFKNRMVAQIPPEPKMAKAPIEDKPKKGVTKAPEDSNEEPGIKAKVDEKHARVALDSSHDTKAIEAVIREVLPRGVYGLYASQVIVVNGKTALLTIDGNIRERDIGQDSASTDSVFNLRMDVETKYSKVGEQQ